MMFEHFDPEACTYLNLNDLFKQFRGENPEMFEGKRNPVFHSAVICQRMVDEFHRRMKKTWSIGGLMEYRGDVWGGSYLEQDKNFTHLGIDVNVPAGTELRASRRMQVVRIDEHNLDQDGGWGTKITLLPLERIRRRGNEFIPGLPPFVIIGHLHEKVRCRVGQVLERGHNFATVADHTKNGGWYHHTHFQSVNLLRAQLTETQGEIVLGGRKIHLHLADLDGYGPSQFEDEKTGIEELRQTYPNPLPYITTGEDRWRRFALGPTS